MAHLGLTPAGPPATPPGRTAHAQTRQGTTESPPCPVGDIFTGQEEADGDVELELPEATWS